MWNRSIASLIAANMLCLGLGGCIFEGDETRPAPTFSIGGTVAGAAGSVVLQNSNGTLLIVVSDGSFKFGTPMVPTALYNVTVVVPPEFHTCRIENGAGTVGLTDIRDVAVTCTPNTYTAGNTVTAHARGPLFRDER
jgi:hypothetical protein